MWICKARAVLLALALHGLTAAAAEAQDRISCAEAHRALVQKLELQKSGPPDRIAAQKRRAQRIYDACITGDVHDTKSLFERLDDRKY